MMKALFTMKTKTLVGSLLFVLILSAGLSAQGVIPTNEWINLYGDQCLLNGSPLPVGAIIDAFDPDGVHCGRWIVTEVGTYGFMPVYRDYSGTPEDEGADPDDSITLKINGKTTLQLGPQVPVWTEKGDEFEVNLSATQTIGINVLAPNGQFSSPGQTLAYHFKVVNTGDGIDLFDLNVYSEHGWQAEITTGNPTEHADPMDSLDVYVSLKVPSNIVSSMVDSLILEATSLMDGSVMATGKTITTVIATSAGDDNSSGLPERFSLSQNYPNPFNPETIIGYSLKHGADVRLEVYNLLGQLAEVLIDGYQDAGEYTIVFNTLEGGHAYPSGVYFYRLTVDQVTLTRKMILMK
jgi:hypothetical protein